MALEKVQMAMFGPNDKQLKRQVKQHQREIDREVRDLKRDLGKNEKEQQRLKTKMQKDAQSGNHDLVKQGAKQVLRTRKQAENINTMIGSLEGVKMQLSSMSSMVAMSRAMKNMTKMMANMNRLMNPQRFARIAAEFQRQAAQAELTEELMQDTISSAMNDDEEAEENLVDSILAEVGLEKMEGLGYVPITDPTKVSAAEEKQEHGPVAVGASAEADDEIDSLEHRLRNLGGGN